MKEKITQRAGENNSTNHLDRILAVPMFFVALAFLLIAGFVIHMETGDLLTVSPEMQSIRMAALISLGVLYLAYIAEALAHRANGSTNMKQQIWYLLLPFLRICPRDHVDGRHVWIVGLGWRERNRSLEKFLSRKFSGPMIVVALLVLPVVAAEIIWASTINTDAKWRFLIQTATGFIWMAFVFEFVVMISVVEKKARYCKKNWIDLAVIAIPFIAFLRAARLGRLMKLQQLSKTARVYRLRGLALRTWRAVVTLDVIDTLMRRNPEYRVEKIQSQIDEKQEEIRRLKLELKAAQTKSVAASSKSASTT